MGYYQVAVIVDGALERTALLPDIESLSRFEHKQKAAAELDGLPTTVYVLWHEHDVSMQECFCVEYETDHTPRYSWNTDG